MTTIESAPDLLQLIPDANTLAALARERAQEYQTNRPYPHIALDNFLPESSAQAALDAFPAPGAIQWYEFREDQQRKLASAKEEQIPPAIRNVLYALNSSTFLTFLEQLTGIQGLIADPHFFGGGMHQIVRGGKLGVHVDFNKHSRLNLDRRLNLLIYLNQDWQDEYGGHFEMWDREGKQCVKKVLPVFNRCVIFSTSSISYHGHPHPLECPANRSRKSMALYYYTNGRPVGEENGTHNTVFLHSVPTRASADSVPPSGSGGQRRSSGVAPPHRVQDARPMSTTPAASVSISA